MNFEALKTRLVEAGIQRVYFVNKVPASPTYPYAVLTVANGQSIGRTVDAQSGIRRGGITLQIFSRTNEGIEALDAAATTALDGAALPETGEDAPTAEQVLVSQLRRDLDDQGVLTVTHAYTY